MLLSRRTAADATDARMLAAADRLFREFDDQPIISVIRALGAARATLRDIGQPVTPEAVESLARTHLSRCRSLIALTSSGTGAVHVDPSSANMTSQPARSTYVQEPSAVCTTA